MIIGIPLVIIFFSILGCIEIKKPVVRGILGIAVGINIMIVVLAAGFIYNSEYKIHDVADSTSQDGMYMLLFQQVGDPDWPFGHTHARLVLKDESGTISKYSFDVLNDGGNVQPDSWKVTWKENCVEAVISGEEQNDSQYILYFDGRTDSNQLETRHGM